MEAAVIIDLLLDLRGLVSRNAFIELLALKVALEDKIRAAPSGLAGRSFKELFAQGAAAQAVNGLQILKQRTSFEVERIEMIWHAAYCIYTDTNNKRK